MWGEEEEDEEEEDEEEAVRPGTAAGCIYKVPKVDTRPNLPPTYLLHKVYIHDILHLNPVRRVPVSLILLAGTIGRRGGYRKAPASSRPVSYFRVRSLLSSFE